MISLSILNGSYQNFIFKMKNLILVTVVFCLGACSEVLQVEDSS